MQGGSDVTGNQERQRDADISQLISAHQPHELDGEEAERDVLPQPLEQSVVLVVAGAVGVAVGVAGARAAPAQGRPRGQRQQRVHEVALEVDAELLHQHLDVLVHVLVEGGARALEHEQVHAGLEQAPARGGVARGAGAAAGVAARRARRRRGGTARWGSGRAAAGCPAAACGRWRGST